MREFCIIQSERIGFFHFLQKYEKSVVLSI